MKTTMKNFLYLPLLLALVVSCLPQEKTTNCESNEAYDSSSRSCVATLGSESTTINITNVTPSSSYAISKTDPARSHTVSISDPYKNGYQVRWSVTQQDGNSTLLGTGLSITFNHSAYTQGNYILEVQVLNSEGSTVFDSRSWSVFVVDDVIPTLTRITASPFSTTLTSPDTTLNVAANNPDGILGVNYQWYVNGSPIAGESGLFSSTLENLSFTFSPKSGTSYFAGASVYTVQVILTENISNAVYNTETWVITNNIPGFANASIGSSALHSTTTPSTASIITTISDLNIASSGFLYDVDSDTVLDPIDFCVQVDDVAGVDGDNVYVDFLIDGTNIPAATNHQMTVAGNNYCLHDYNNFFYSLPSNIVQESHTISAVVYDKYTGNSNKSKYNGYTQLDKFTWTIRVRQKNSPPSIAIDDASQSVISCGSKTTTTQSACSITQDTAFQVALTVSDDDFNSTDYNQFKVEFFLDNVLIDGTHPKALTSDCYHDYGETLNAAKYICTINITSYDTAGPIDITGLNYFLSAKVTDNGTLPYGGTPEESNVVYWNINSVTEINSSTAVNTFALDNADLGGDPTQSYISTQALPANAIDLASGTVTEGDIIQFHVKVDDPERDSHIIKIERCTDALCTGVVFPAITTVTTNSTSALNPKETTINYQVTEEEVTGTNQANVYYRVTVTDIPNTPALVRSDQEIVQVLVTNYNPDPTFNASNFVPTIPSALVAFSGFPVSIDPGTISDISIADGNNINYQWQYIVDTDRDDLLTDETWANLDGATARTLTWVPSPEIDAGNPASDGTAVAVRLCLGDDGVNGAGAAKLADCSNATLDTSGGVIAAAWEMTVFSNMAYGRSHGDNSVANVSSGEIATWVDPTSTNPVVKYIAYVNIGKEIIIEKIVTTTNGTRHGSVEIIEEIKSISFNASTDINFATNGVTNLSIAGDPVGNSLYLAYMAPIAGVDQVHIRRIDISPGKLGFTHQGKFGWDSGYDDLTNNISIVSAGIDPPVVSAGGEIEINFTDSANNTAMNVTFNGIMGGILTLVGGTDFCAPTTLCTTTATTASTFADVINNSLDPEIQGITASVVGSLVTLEGIVDGDFLELDAGATTIGKIMVNNGALAPKWQLPLIDHDLSGADKSKISMLSGDLATRLTDSNAVKSLLTGTAQAQEITNDHDSENNIIVGVKVLGTGEINVYEYDKDSTLQETALDVFGNNNISNIKMAVSKEDTEFNQSAFITGKNVDDRMAFARFDSDGADNFDLVTYISNVDLDGGFSLIQNIENYDITAGSSQYQLLIGIVSDPNSDTTFETYLLNVSNAVPTVDCSYDNSQAIGKCQPLFSSTGDTTFNLGVSLGEVLEDVTIGTDGATAGEATNDLLPIVFHIDDGGGNIATDAVPLSGLINSSDTTVSTNENNAGAGHIIPYVSP